MRVVKEITWGELTELDLDEHLIVYVSEDGEISPATHIYQLGLMLVISSGPGVKHGKKLIGDDS